MGKEFDDAFGAAVADMDNPAGALGASAEPAAPAAEPAVVPAVEPAAPAAPAVEPAVVPAVEPAAPAVVVPAGEIPAVTPAAVAPAAPVTPAEPVKQADPAITALQAEIARLSEALNKVTNPPAATPAAKPAEAPKPATAETILSEDERKTLSTYEEDWPEVSAAENLRRKLHGEQIKEEVYKAIGPVLSSIIGQINPMIQSQDKAHETAHFAAIRAEVPDFGEKLIGEVRAWVASQPAYLKRAGEAVLADGSAEEVVSLFKGYKEQTGIAKPQEPIPLVNTTSPNVVALRPVQGGVKPSVPNPIDANDFDGAWQAAAAAKD